MRFLDLYESDEQKTSEQITIEKILGDLDGIYKDDNKYVKFLNNIRRPGQEATTAFTYGGDPSNGNKGGKSISYTADRTSKQPSDDFRQIMSKIKDGHTGEWREKIESLVDKVNDPKIQQYIKTIFIPKLENPGINLTTRATRHGDYRVPGEEHYTKFGQALVFYAGKCVSKITDADTKIGPEKFKLIMQGCFGAAPGGKHEDDDFLTQFKNLEDKLKIDAAKNVINSIHSAGTNDIERTDDDVLEDSYYSGVSFLVKNKLFEADEVNNDDVKFPKTLDDFSNDVATAAKQAKAVAEKYPKQYKLWYEKLRAAFDRGVEEYQKIERDPDTKEIVNPITGEKEHRHGKAWGAGGPNAFIRDNPDLKAITDKIRQGTPGCEGVNGWDIFNCGPKLILTMFDALEKGGKIYQKLCDDLSSGMRDLKRSLGTTKPGDFDKLIKKYATENQHNKAMEMGFCSVMCSIANLYKTLANGVIGQINLTTKTFNSKNIGNENIIQVKVDDLKNSLAQVMKEKPDYDKWKEEENKKHDEKVKKLEEEIAGLKKSSEEKVESVSTTVSVKSILTEEENETKNQKKVQSVKEELENKEKELSKLKKQKFDAVKINVKNYIAILDNYKNILGLEPFIKEVGNFIDLVFDPSYAEDQYQALHNNDNDNNSGESVDQEEETNEALNVRLAKIADSFKLFEAEEETVDPDEVDDQDDNGSSNKSEDKSKEVDNKPNKPAEKKDEIQYSKNPGNLDWTKRDQAKGLKAIYDLFGNGTDRVRIKVSEFKDLVDVKKEKEALNHINDAFKALFDTLKKINVEPIVDGIIGLNKIDEGQKIPGAFEVVGEKKEEDKKDDKKKDEEKPKEEQKSTVDQLKEQQANLLKFIDESSPIMTNIVAKLNDTVRSAKDDSWINTYKTFEESFNNEGRKVIEYLHNIFKDNKDGQKWLAEQEAKIKEGNFLVRIHHVVSMVKVAYTVLDNQIDKEKEEELKKEQQSGKLNSSVEIDNTEPVLAEAQAKVHSVETVTDKLKAVEGRVDFNVLLPTNFKSGIYGFGEDAAKEFNSTEANISKNIGLYKKAETSPNSLFSILNTLVGTTKSDNDVLKGVDISKLPCKQCIEHFNYDTRTQQTKGVDRNIYFLYGCIRAIIACLNQLDTKTKQGNERVVGGEKPQESYIPEVSPNTLMNEIYKYIRGN